MDFFHFFENKSKPDLRQLQILRFKRLKKKKPKIFKHLQEFEPAISVKIDHTYLLTNKT